MIHLALTAMSLALLDPTAAFAAPNPPRQPTPAPVAKRVPTATTRYCTVNTPTGSIIPTRICHTRSEWLELGFDPLVRQ